MGNAAPYLATYAPIPAERPRLNRSPSLSLTTSAGSSLKEVQNDVDSGLTQTLVAGAPDASLARTAGAPITSLARTAGAPVASLARATGAPVAHLARATGAHDASLASTAGAPDASLARAKGATGEVLWRPAPGMSFAFIISNHSDSLKSIG